MTDGRKETHRQAHQRIGEESSSRAPQGAGPTAPASAETQGETDLAQEIDNLNFSLEKSLRYHARRRAHYERLNRFLMFLVLLSGSAAFAAAFGTGPWFGLAAAVFGAIELVWNFSHKARDHEALCRRFSDLAAKLRTEDVDLPTLRRAVAERLAIESGEPPIFWGVEADCFNEVLLAWGRDPNKQTPISWFGRLCMNWFRFERLQRKPRPSAAEATS